MDPNDPVQYTGRCDLVQIKRMNRSCDKEIPCKLVAVDDKINCLPTFDMHVRGDWRNDDSPICACGRRRLSVKINI